MKSATGQMRIGRPAFYLAAVLLVVAVWLLQSHATLGYLEPEVTSLTALQERQLDAFLEMNRLITTLSTGLLAALGFLLVNAHKASPNADTPWTAIGAAACVSVSLLFGYVVYRAILWMLESHFFDLGNSYIVWPGVAHFYTFLLGVLFFADFAYHQMREEQ